MSLKEQLELPTRASNQPLAIAIDWQVNSIRRDNPL